MIQNNNKILIDLRNVSFSYDHHSKILDDISLQITENEFIGIIGPNGGGKTTLLKIILGLLKPQSGEIYTQNNIHNNLKIGYLPQINDIDKKFPITVQEVLLSGLTSEKMFLRKHKEHTINRLKEVAKSMNISNLLDKTIGNLSGGQLQRTMLGRAIIDNPKLLVLDEPDTYIDSAFELEFYELLRELNKQTAIILVSHGIDTVVKHAKNIIFINQSIYKKPSDTNVKDWIYNLNINRRQLY